MDASNSLLTHQRTDTMSASSDLQSAQTQISVIVPSFNRAHYLQGALDSLTRQETDDRFCYEVLIVDNASQDNTREVVETFAATSPVPVRYLLESTPGDAPPRNKGIAESDGQWVAFFDDDQFAEPRWLLNLLHVAEKNTASIVGGPVHLDLDEETIEQLSPACRRALRETKPYAIDRPCGRNVIPGTGNMLVARELFEQIGVFREDMKQGGSDWKFVEDAKAHGVTPWYAAQAAIRHRVDRDRMTPDYFRWDATNGGINQANTDFRTKGAAGLLLRCALRAGRTAVRCPLRLLAIVRPPACGSSESCMIWWRTEGYLRRSLTLLAPAFFPQDGFYQHLNLRLGRQVGV